MKSILTWVSALSYGVRTPAGNASNAAKIASKDGDVERARRVGYASRLSQIAGLRFLRRAVRGQCALASTPSWLERV
jgi:hypothetical protein